MVFNTSLVYQFVEIVVTSQKGIALSCLPFSTVSLRPNFFGQVFEKQLFSAKSKIFEGPLVATNSFVNKYLEVQIYFIVYECRLYKVLM